MSYSLMRDRPEAEEGYAEFVLESLAALRGDAVRGVALVAIMERQGEDGCDARSAYWHMNERDKGEAAEKIQMDVTVNLIKKNLQNFLKEMDGGRKDEQ